MSEKISVYWTNCNELGREIDKSLWYPKPTNVYKRHAANRNPEIPENGTTLFMCPAVQNKLKNVWSFHSSVEIKVTIKDGTIAYSSGLPLHPTPRQNSILDSGHLWIDMGWLFFSDAPLLASFTSPYFDSPKHLSQMSVPPAQFDIGKWFRPFNAEFIVWDLEYSEIVIAEGDPLFYVEFHTDKKIELQRFEESPRIIQYATGCSKSTQFFGRNRDLDTRYKDFENSDLPSMILREIKQNLV
jgi:hypothetical protein